MKTINFNKLPLTEKALLIAEFGIYLDSLEFYSYWIHLYSIHSHFIEVYFNTKTKQIDKISMPEYEDLDKYLSKIFLNVMRKC